MSALLTSCSRSLQTLCCVPTQFWVNMYRHTSDCTLRLGPRLNVQNTQRHGRICIEITAVSSVSLWAESWPTALVFHTLINHLSSPVMSSNWVHLLKFLTLVRQRQILYKYFLRHNIYLITWVSLPIQFVCCNLGEFFLLRLNVYSSSRAKYAGTHPSVMHRPLVKGPTIH